MKEFVFLRPHHSLCMNFFVGKGYNQEFIFQMTKIIHFLEQKNPIVTLTENGDIICENCPNYIHNFCISHKKVNLIDKNCLAKYHLNFGDKISYQELKNLAQSEIIQQKKIKTICQDCQWLALCQ